MSFLYLLRYSQSSQIPDNLMLRIATCDSVGLGSNTKVFLSLFSATWLAWQFFRPARFLVRNGCFYLYAFQILFCNILWCVYFLILIYMLNKYILKLFNRCYLLLTYKISTSVFEPTPIKLGFLHAFKMSTVYPTKLFHLDNMHWTIRT